MLVHSEWYYGPMDLRRLSQSEWNGRMGRINTFKPLRVGVANDLKWAQHVDSISILSKVSSRLYDPQAAEAICRQDDLLCVI